MRNNQINLFISFFCKELSLQLDPLTRRNAPVDPSEFMETVTETVQSILESYKAGEADLFICEQALAEEYKELALKSIDSYSASNKNLESISKQQAILFDKANDEELIDLNAISEKFNDIQTLLNSEVTRANSVINGLLEQVRTLEAKNSMDPLTKAYNRYALHEYLQNLLFVDKFDFDVFVLMIDIDNFKHINDTYGHIAGDKVLIFITKLMKKALRDGDRVFRFGGEEFIVLINRTDMDGTMQVCERLMNLCRQNQPLFQNVQIPVTMSVGITKVRPDDTIDTIIERSDKALYRAKHNGKDCIETEI